MSTMSDEGDTLAGIRDNPCALADLREARAVAIERGYALPDAESALARIATLEADLEVEQSISERMRKRAEVAEHELVKAGRTIAVYRNGYDEMCSALGADPCSDPDPVEIAKGLRAEVERLRAVCNGAAQAMEDSRAARNVWAPSSCADTWPPSPRGPRSPATLSVRRRRAGSCPSWVPTCFRQWPPRTCTSG